MGEQIAIAIVAFLIGFLAGNISKFEIRAVIRKRWQNGSKKKNRQRD